MKKYIQFIIAGLFVISYQTTVFAYRYTFSNHTQYPLMIGIKLCCAFEDLIIKTVKPDRMVTFVHGQDFPDIKFGYCLQSISYVKNPTIKNKLKPKSAPWTEINTTWVKTETYDDIVDFAESLGYGTEQAGKLIAKLVAASAATTATGGAAAPAIAAAEGAQQIVESNPPTKTKEAKKGSKTSLGLSKIAKGLAKLVAITTCRDRHWDIYEDENGKIVFISKIQQ